MKEIYELEADRGEAHCHPLPDGSFYVLNVVIRAEERGRGHGRRLVALVCADADREQVTLYLHAASARGFWEKMGWEVVDPPERLGHFRSHVAMRRRPC